MLSFIYPIFIFQARNTGVASNQIAADDTNQDATGLNTMKPRINKDGNPRKFVIVDI